MDISDGRFSRVIRKVRMGDAQQQASAAFGFAHQLADLAIRDEEHIGRVVIFILRGDHAGDVVVIANPFAENRGDLFIFRIRQQTRQLNGQGFIAMDHQAICFVAR